MILPGLACTSATARRRRKRSCSPNPTCPVSHSRHTSPSICWRTASSTAAGLTADVRSGIGGLRFGVAGVATTEDEFRRFQLLDCLGRASLMLVDFGNTSGIGAFCPSAFWRRRYPGCMRDDDPGQVTYETRFRADERTHARTVPILASGQNWDIIPKTITCCAA